MNPCQQQLCEPAAGDDREVCVRDELRKGRQAATELLWLIKQQKQQLSPNANASSSFNNPAAALDLVVKIVDSFSNSLSMVGCQDPSGSGTPMMCCKSSPKASGGRSGCRKLRKGSSNSWSQLVTSDITTDRYAWKKYGQKPILNAKHPRSYYKCVNTPHCQASKRVQKIADEPPMYEITHTSHHTCENPASSNPSSGFSDLNSSIFLSFDSENYKQQQSNYSSAAGSGIQRAKEQYCGIQQQADDQYSLMAPSINMMDMEPITAPKLDAQWSLDDLDYLIGSVDFKDHY